MYCSVNCSKLSRFKYSEEEIIQSIREYYEKENRIPPKRDLTQTSHRAINIFGSWNNAITKAGLIPNRSHDNKMYKRTMGMASDGHKCDSASEIIIDDWLTRNDIPHNRNQKYPTSNHKSDWSVQDGKIFIEYFGLAKDSPRYDRSIKYKKGICRKFGIKLIDIYPADLYPMTSLDSKLSALKK